MAKDKQQVISRSIPLVALFFAGLPTIPAQAQTDPTAVPDSLEEAVVYTTLRPPNWE